MFVLGRMNPLLSGGKVKVAVFGGLGFSGGGLNENPCVGLLVGGLTIGDPCGCLIGGTVCGNNPPTVATFWGFSVSNWEAIR